MIGLATGIENGTGRDAPIGIVEHRDLHSSPLAKRFRALPYTHIVLDEVWVDAGHVSTVDELNEFTPNIGMIDIVRAGNNEQGNDHEFPHTADHGTASGSAL